MKINYVGFPGRIKNFFEKDKDNIFVSNFFIANPNGENQLQFPIIKIKTMLDEEERRELLKVLEKAIEDKKRHTKEVKKALYKLLKPQTLLPGNFTSKQEQLIKTVVAFHDFLDNFQEIHASRPEKIKKQIPLQTNDGKVITEHKREKNGIRKKLRKTHIDELPQLIRYYVVKIENLKIKLKNILLGKNEDLYYVPNMIGIRAKTITAITTTKLYETLVENSGNSQKLLDIILKPENIGIFPIVDYLLPEDFDPSDPLQKEYQGIFTKEKKESISDRKKKIKQIPLPIREYVAIKNKEKILRRNKFPLLQKIIEKMLFFTNQSKVDDTEKGIHKTINEAREYYIKNTFKDKKGKETEVAKG